MAKKVLTLGIVHTPELVLLGMKKVRWGAGKWNGFGGKVEPGETIEEGVRREVEEEVGLIPRRIRKAGILDFVYDTNAAPLEMEVHVFGIDRFTGEPMETDEMIPQWFSKDSLPWKTMWASDRHWYPPFLEGKLFRGKILFSKDFEVKRKLIQEVDALD